MILDSAPLIRGKLHALPVVISGCIDIGESGSEFLVHAALGISNVCLEFDYVDTGRSKSVDIGMENPETPVMCLPDFSDDPACIHVKRLSRNEMTGRSVLTKTSCCIYLEL